MREMQITLNSAKKCGKLQILRQIKAQKDEEW